MKVETMHTVKLHLSFCWSV